MSGRGVTADAWRSTGYFPALNNHRFVLLGDHRPWKLVASWENVQAQCMEVTLRVDDYRAVTALKVKDNPGGGGVVAVIYSDGEDDTAKSTDSTTPIGIPFQADPHSFERVGPRPRPR